LESGAIGRNFSRRKKRTNALGDNGLTERCRNFSTGRKGEKHGAGGVCMRRGMPFRGSGAAPEEEDKKIRNDIQEQVSVL